MYLVFYPAGSNKFERHSFDDIDTNNVNDCTYAFKQLYLEFKNDNDFHYYNMSTTDRSSRHPNLDDFTEDANNEEVSLENCWTIWLNLSEKQVEDAIDEAETEILNRQGDGETEYFIITDELLPFVFDDECKAWFDLDDCKLDFEKDCDVCIIAVKSFQLENNGNGQKFISLVLDTDTNKVIAEFSHTGKSFDKGLMQVCNNMKWYFGRKRSNEK